MSTLAEDLLGGDHRALARVITRIENRKPGYRDLVSELHEHTGSADIIGITGSPGSGKSTLVDKLAATYRERGLTVGVIAIDPSSPFTGGAVLGDRIRMGSNVGDMDVFFRSMSARGRLGGLSTATTDAVTALDAFGKDRILVETVGAGQNEIDIVRTADTVTVLVPPGSGDDVQMLKAGILEIGDVFVVNKADLAGADRTVQELREMLSYREGGVPQRPGHHGSGSRRPGDTPAPEDNTGVAPTNHPTGEGGPEPGSDGADTDDRSHGAEVWEPAIVETVANTGEGIDELLSVFADHARFLDESGQREKRRRTRYAEEIRTLLREDVTRLVTGEIETRGGLDRFVQQVIDGETTPYEVADELVESIADHGSERQADDS